MAPAKPAAGKKLLGLNKYAWAGIIALGVVVFWYVRKQGGNTARNATNADNGTGGLDEGQLASDIAGQTSAALGGTPADNSAYDNIAGLLDWQTQSLEDYFSTQYGGATAAGGLGPTATGTGATAGGATASGATAVASGASGDDPLAITDPATFAAAPPPAPGESVSTLSQGGVQITPGTVVTSPNPGAGIIDIASGIAGLGGAAGGVYVPPSGYATSTPFVPSAPTPAPTPGKNVAV